MYLEAINSSSFSLLCRAGEGQRGDSSSRHREVDAGQVPGLSSSSCLWSSLWLRLGVYCLKGQSSGVGTTYLAVERVYVPSLSLNTRKIYSRYCDAVMLWYWDFLSQGCNWAEKGSSNASKIYPFVCQVLSILLRDITMFNKVFYFGDLVSTFKFLCVNL